METRGRKKKTREQKILEGTARSDRDGYSVSADLTMPMAPSWLTDAEFEIWKRLAPRLNTRSILSFDDGDSFGLFCYWYNRFIECKDGDNTLEIRRCSEMVDKLGAKFGYSPADRASLKIEMPKEVDPLEELMKRKLKS